MSLLKRYKVKLGNGEIFYIVARSIEEACDAVREVYPGWSFSVSDT